MPPARHAAIILIHNYMSQSGDSNHLLTRDNGLRGDAVTKWRRKAKEEYVASH